MGKAKQQSGTISFSPKRQVNNVGFSLLGAFEYAPKHFGTWRTATEEKINWGYGKDIGQNPHDAYHITECFFLDKQHFFGRRNRMASMDAIRGHVAEATILKINLANRELELKFDVVISYFRDRSVLTLNMFCNIDRTDIDTLIFLKELKWFFSDYSESCISFVEHEEHVNVRSVHEIMLTIIKDLGAGGVVTRNWPIFDFIELRDVGPAIGRGPNQDNPLSIEENWGLLVGDEGYRLIDSHGDKYLKRLIDENKIFDERKTFIYQFSSTSCLGFLNKDSSEIRYKWSEYYKKNIGYIYDLDNYISFDTKIPCLTDGIPLIVEICLLRYIELSHVHKILEDSIGSNSLGNLASRFRGKTPLERAVNKLHGLDLYQDSCLWIIGGDYTDALFGYSRLRSQIDRSIDLNLSTSNDITAFVLTIFSLLVALLSLAVAWKALAS